MPADLSKGKKPARLFSLFQTFPMGALALDFLVFCRASHHAFRKSEREVCDTRRLCVGPQAHSGIRGVAILSRASAAGNSCVLLALLCLDNPGRHSL